MKVKYKALAIAGITGVIVVLVAWLIFYKVYFGYINEEHSKEIKKAVKTVEQITSYEENNLESVVIDWAHWNDTYEFISNKNKEFIESNLQNNSLKNLKINMMIFLDTRGNLVYSAYYGLDKEIVGDICSKESFINNERSNNKPGILIIKDKILLVCASPILKSDEQSPRNGTLIMLRQVNEKYIKSFEGVSDYTYKLSNITDSKNVKFKNINQDYVIYQNKKSIQMNKLMKDINGEKTIVLSLSKQNNSYSDMIRYFHRFIIYFLIFMIVILSINYVLLNKYIFERFISLYNFIVKVTTTKDTSLRVEMSGKDELFILSNATNEMLSMIDSNNKDIKKMNERFRIIMEATNDGYLDCLLDTKEIYISSKWRKFIGYKDLNSAKLYENYISKIHPDCLEKIKKDFKKIMDNKSEYLNIEYRLIRESGEIIWVNQRGKVVEKDVNNRPLRIVSTLANITDRKKYEEEILFLSYSDKLTGLKNRAYMEKQFHELDKTEESKYFIVMGDLNGLKLTNDELGHKKGDKLILMIGEIFKETCEDDDIISRWGGDEFIILIKNKDEKYVAGIVDNIRKKCRNINNFLFETSISLGYAQKDKSNTSVESVMSLAEKRMYRNKLMENKSARNSIISSLLRTLHEKHSETEEHTMRIKNLSSKLGKKLGLTQDKLDELELLSLLHDIGKIGIPEHILMKPSKLTEEEWVIMKSHTDIGYRIAKYTPELAHIAEGILYHHERYDGTGYPSGLKGKEIPLISRIINIVDSFDVMTNKRVYKEAFDMTYAVDEINRCSGTQFDPFIAEEFIKLLMEEETI